MCKYNGLKMVILFLLKCVTHANGTLHTFYAKKEYQLLHIRKSTKV